MQAKGPFVLSHFQTRVLERAWQEGRRTVQVSLDLGLSTVEVTLSAEGVVLPDGQQLPWAEIEAISAAESACFTIENQAAVLFRVPEPRLQPAAHPRCADHARFGRAHAPHQRHRSLP